MKKGDVIGGKESNKRRVEVSALIKKGVNPGCPSFPEPVVKEITLPHPIDI